LFLAVVYLLQSWDWGSKTLSLGGQMKLTLTKNTKFKNTVLFLGFSTLSFLGMFAFQNCQGETKFVTVEEMSSFSLASAEDELFDLIQESESLQKKLSAYDISADSESEMLQKKNDIVDKLKSKTDLIVKMITIDGVATNSTRVLKEVDILLNSLSTARDVQVTYDSIRRDKLLDLKFTDLVESLRIDFGQFKAITETRLDGIDKKVTDWGLKQTELKNAFENFRVTTMAEDAAIKMSIKSLQDMTEAKILALKEDGKKLAERITAQEKASEEAKLALQKVADLQNKLCKVDENGTAIIVNNCLTVEAIKCDTLIQNPVDNAEAVRQCQLMVDVAKNHDAQLRALKEVDEKQNELITGIISDVKNLNQQVQTAAGAIANLSDSIQILAGKVADIDERLMIVEFKAKRAEAAASIKSKAHFYLSWTTRRSADITREFCEQGTRSALNNFDYEAANQQWAFCHEKLSVLNKARELANIALAFSNDLESVNVESKCNIAISSANAKPAESLVQSELLKDSVAKEILQKCTQGGSVLAKVMMLNAVKFLGQLGPDHRTYAYMGKLAPIASIIFLGDVWEKVSSSTIDQFQVIDPTSANLKDTYYGQVERLFVNRYIENVFRVNGEFPTDPNAIKMPGNLGQVFTHAQILAASPVGSRNGTQYMARLKALEVDCSDCGFTMIARNKASRGSGKLRYSFPLDARSNMCPIDDDVILEQNSAFYGYHISYNHVVENFKPYLIQGNHTAIVANRAALSNGEFLMSSQRVIVPRAGFETAQIPTRLILRATKPYGNAYNRAHCVKFTFVNGLKNNEWTKPAAVSDASGLSRYLNGFNSDFIGNACAAKDFPIEVFASGQPGRRSPASYNEDRDGRSKVSLLRQAWSQPDGSNASSTAQKMVAIGSTQLTSDYFMYADRALTYATAANGATVSFSKSAPFFLPVGSGFSSTEFIREFDKTAAVLVQECNYCKRDQDLANLNPACDPVKINDLPL
jgi:hypothetical protein